ncbi:MAG: metallopeptidase TldD-related protein [Candidatus Thorarchaeota archaeon]
MSDEKVGLIEKILKSNGVKEYEIYLTNGMAYESIMLKYKIDKVREINSYDYVLRILDQREQETGIGIIRGNSFKPQEIEKNIKTCIKLSKINRETKYSFPSKSSVPKISTFDKNIVKNPLDNKNELVQELLSEIQNQKNVTPTFGRFRIHIDDIHLKNSTSVDYNALKSYFFLEFSLKAQKNGNLAEFWPFIHVKDKKHLNFSSRIDKWAQLAQDTLKAKLPKSSNNAIIIFSPQTLHYAINPVVEFHASGRAFHEKITLFNLNEKVGTENLSIIDDGLLEDCLAVNGWDREGTSHQRNEIIKNGIFQKMLFDQKYALLENSVSTGNGVISQSGSVKNGISNLEILPGNISLDEMVSNISEGYYIEKFSDLDPSELTGDFGAEIRNGYYIKNGKFENPIKQGNVSGNVIEMMNHCLYISKEREYFANTLFPYIAFTNLTVSS